MVQPRLAVSAASKSYGALRALDRLTLQVRAGEFSVLLGANGAGKSTLFELLSGLFVPDAGDIRICGIDLGRNPALALANLGIVFQQPALDLDLSPRGNLRFHAGLHGMGAAAHSRIEAALSQFGFSPSAASAPCRALSGGNRRKVELARALLHAPALLLMDEPTVGLDPASRLALLQDVKARCVSDGLAVFWASHLVDEGAQADRIFVLHHGRLMAQGTPAQLMQQQGAKDLEQAFLRMTAGAAARGMTA
jgi:ABC-2 type transport system ATP-binding protein